MVVGALQAGRHPATGGEASGGEACSGPIKSHAVLLVLRVCSTRHLLDCASDRPDVIRPEMHARVG